MDNKLYHILDKHLSVAAWKKSFLDIVVYYMPTTDTIKRTPNISVTTYSRNV